MYKLWVQGSTNCGILPSPMREHGVSLENMENMEKMENDKRLAVACYRYECDSPPMYSIHCIPYPTQSFSLYLTHQWKETPPDKSTIGPD